MLPKHILVPTDLSEGAEQALDYACELARMLGAEIHLLNVVAIPAMGVPELGVAPTSTTVIATRRELAGDTRRDHVRFQRRGLVARSRTAAAAVDGRRSSSTITS